MLIKAPTSKSHKLDSKMIIAAKPREPQKLLQEQSGDL
jgi:hypothetical protein